MNNRRRIEVLSFIHHREVKGETRCLISMLIQDINGMAGHYKFWDTFMKLLSNDGEYLFFSGIFVYWFMRNAHTRRMVRLEEKVWPGRKKSARS